MSNQGADAWMTRDGVPGVIWGLTVRDPQSATLTTTIEGGWVNVQNATVSGKVDTYAKQPVSKAYTASKDTYTYINGADGVLTHLELANGAVVPSQTTIGANSQRLALVVTDGTRITDGGVTDWRGKPAAATVFPLNWPGEISFVTANQGAYDIYAPCNGYIVGLVATVISAVGGTDTGTITVAICKNNKPTNVTNGVITAAISAAFGVKYTVTPSAANVFQTGNIIRATSLKTTTGGLLTLSAICVRLPQ